MMVSAANWILVENPNPYINIPISFDTGISQTGGLFANICNVFVDNITVGSVSEDFQPFCNEVFTHEIAHQFSLSVSPDHIDFRSPDTDDDGIPDEPIFPDHTYDGNVHHQCIMSYNNLWYDGHAEFDLNLSNDAIQIQTGCGPDYDYVPTGCIRDIRWDEILK